MPTPKAGGTILPGEYRPRKTGIHVLDWGHRVDVLNWTPGLCSYYAECRDLTDAGNEVTRLLCLALANTTHYPVYFADMTGGKP
jgi:hypothetical protein